MVRKAASKTCSKCGVEKPHTEFNKNSRRKDGLNSKCRLCCKVYNNERYKKNRSSFILRAKKAKEKYKEDNIKYGVVINRKDGEILDFNNSVQIDVDYCHKTGNIRGILYNKYNLLFRCN